MGEPTDNDEFNQAGLNPLQRFGADVRRVRLGRKLTQTHLGKAIGYSVSYVCQVEAGRLVPSQRFAEGCDTTFGTNGLFADLLHRLEEGDHPSAFVPYVQLERKADYILHFSTSLIMGLFQTEEYARAIFRAGHPHESDAVIEDKVRARIRRRDALGGKGPKLWVVLHEACLRSYVGGCSVMANQLDYLIEVASQPGADFQVLPFASGAAAVHTGPFTLLTFSDSSTVLYSEDQQGGRLYRKDETVAATQQIFDRLRAHALPPDESLAFIDAVRKEYAT